MTRRRKQEEDRKENGVEEESIDDREGNEMRRRKRKQKIGVDGRRSVRGEEDMKLKEKRGDRVQVKETREEERK